MATAQHLSHGLRPRAPGFHHQSRRPSIQDHPTSFHTDHRTRLSERRALWARMGPSRLKQGRGKPPAAAGHAAATSPFLEPGPGRRRHPWQQQKPGGTPANPRSAPTTVASQRRGALSHRAPPSGHASDHSSKHPKHQERGAEPPLLRRHPNQPTWPRSRRLPAAQAFRGPHR